MDILWTFYGHSAESCGTLEIPLGHFWVTLRVTLGTGWGHFGVTLGSLWGHFVVALGSLRGLFGPLWGHFGVTLGSLLERNPGLSRNSTFWRWISGLSIAFCTARRTEFSWHDQKIVLKIKNKNHQKLHKSWFRRFSTIFAILVIFMIFDDFACSGV